MGLIPRHLWPGRQAWIGYMGGEGTPGPYIQHTPTHASFEFINQVYN
jgi:hypothetical protein